MKIVLWLEKCLCSVQNEKKYSFPIALAFPIMVY